MPCGGTTRKNTRRRHPLDAWRLEPVVPGWPPGGGFGYFLVDDCASRSPFERIEGHEAAQCSPRVGTERETTHWRHPPAPREAKFGVAARAGVLATFGPMAERVGACWRGLRTTKLPNTSPEVMHQEISQTSSTHAHSGVQSSHYPRKRAFWLLLGPLGTARGRPQSLPLPPSTQGIHGARPHALERVRYLWTN